MREASSRIIDSLPEIGGQLTTLYPEKWIFDVPGHPRCSPRTSSTSCASRRSSQFDVPVHLETTAHEIAWEDDLVVLQDRQGRPALADGDRRRRPRRLRAQEAAGLRRRHGPWEGRGATYLVGEKREFEGKRVVIVGGGDSAFDWVVNLLDTASEITLVHRRDGFRAHEATVSEVMGHVDAGHVKRSRGPRRRGP